MSRIAIGNDHAGYRLKLAILRHLHDGGHEVVDLGHHDDASVDYPVYGRRVAEAVARGEHERGIVICGTGVGISIAANKVKGIRCVCCTEPYSAVLSRRHNDTNVLALGARVVGAGLATMIVDAWLAEAFEGGRHTTRIAQITAAEA
jgi:ribose 5-phosphate isomerase B